MYIVSYILKDGICLTKQLYPFGSIYYIALNRITRIAVMCIYVTVCKARNHISTDFSLGRWVMYNFNYILKDFICLTKQVYSFGSIYYIALHRITRITVMCIYVTVCKTRKHISNDFSLGRWAMYKFNYIFKDFICLTKQLYPFS